MKKVLSAWPVSTSSFNGWKFLPGRIDRKAALRGTETGGRLSVVNAALHDAGSSPFCRYADLERSKNTHGICGHFPL